MKRNRTTFLETLLIPLFMLLPFQIAYAQEATNNSTVDTGTLFATIAGGIIGVAGSLVSVVYTNVINVKKEKRDRSVALIQDKGHVYSLLVSGLQRIIPADLSQRKEIAKEIDSIIREKSHLVNPNIVTNWSTIAASLHYYKPVERGRRELMMRQENELSPIGWENLQIDILALRTLIVHEYNKVIVPAYNATAGTAAGIGYTKEFDIVAPFPLKGLRADMHISEEAREKENNEKNIQIEVKVLDAVEGFPVAEALVSLQIFDQSTQQTLYSALPRRTSSDGKHVFEVEELPKSIADKYYNAKLQVAHDEYESITVEDKLEVN